LRAVDLHQYIGRQVTVEAYLVTVKKTRTTRGDTMFFGNFLDRDGHFVDTVHFPPVANKYRFQGKGIYTLTGKVVEEFDCITIEISKMERLAIIQDPRYAMQSMGYEKLAAQKERRRTERSSYGRQA